MSKTIIFDARVCDGKVHGISRVSEMLLYQIIKHDNENRYVIFCANDYIAGKLPRKKNIEFQKIESKLYSVDEQWNVLKAANRVKPDLFHSPTFTAPYFAGFPVVINIHDLTPMIYPEFFHMKYKFYYNLFVKSVAKKATRIITSSQCSKNDICRLFSVNEDKVNVVFDGGYSENDKKIPYTLNGIKPGFVLFVGNQMPHKNFIRSVKAFDEFRKKVNDRDIYFVAVGISDEFFANSEVSGIKNVLCVKYIDPSRLQSIYEKAGVLLFASLYEGFGIPPIEAMSYGVPVISSNISCMPEILRDAYFSVDPQNVQQMANALVKLYYDKNLQDILIKKGYSQSKKYSWEKSAVDVINIYKDILR